MLFPVALASLLLCSSTTWSADGRASASTDAELQALRLKADEGDARSQGMLAAIFRWQGKTAEAIKYARAAADRGDPLGRYYFGWMCKEGEGISKDPRSGAAMIAEALPKLRAQAEGGDVYAQTAVGMSYFFGESLPEDNAKALACIGPAAKQGDPQALYLRGFMYQHGLGKRENANLAIADYKAAAESGHAQATITLFDEYIKGESATTGRAGGLRKAPKRGRGGSPM